MAANPRWDAAYQPRGTSDQLLKLATANPIEDTLTKLERVGQQAGMALATSNAEADVMAGGTPSEKLPITPAAIAYNRAAQEAYAVRTETQIKTKIAEISGQFDGRNASDPESFAKVYDAHVGALVGAVPESMRPRVQAEIALRRAEALSSLTERTNARQFQLHSQEIKAGVDSDIEEAASRARLLHNPAVPGELLSRAFARIDSGTQLGMWTEEQARIMRTNAEATVQAENIFGMATSTGNLDSTYQGVLSGKIAPELPLDVRDRLTSQLSQEIGHRHAMAAAANAEVERAVRANTYVARTLIEANKAGAVLTPEQQSAQTAMLSGKMQITSDVYDDLRVAAAVPHIGAAITSLPLAQAEAYAQQFAPPVAVPNQQQIDALKAKVPPGREGEFAAWFAENGKGDSGANYDYVQAWLDGETADPASGHWSDKYKLPNHPTFSTDSLLAKDFPDLAGTWNGETYTQNKKRGFDTAQAKVWDIAQDAVKKQRSLLMGNDPVQGLFDLGKLSDPGQGGTPPMAFDTPDNFVATLTDRARRVSRAEAQYHQSFPLFTQSEVSEMRASLDALSDPAQRVAALAAITNVATEEQAAATFRQLDKAGATHYAIIGQTARTVGADVAHDIAVGGMIDRKMKAGLLKAEGVSDSTMKDFNETAGTLFRDNTRERSRWFSAARDLYSARAFRTGEGYTKAGFQEAVRDALGGIHEVTTNGPFFYGGQTSKLPGAKGIDYQSKIDTITGSDIASMGGTNLKLPPDEVAKLIRETGGFTYNSDGSLGVTVQLSGGLVTLAGPDGQTPFRLKF